MNEIEGVVETGIYVDDLTRAEHSTGMCWGWR